MYSLKLKNVKIQRGENPNAQHKQKVFTIYADPKSMWPWIFYLFLRNQININITYKNESMNTLLNKGQCLSHRVILKQWRVMKVSGTVTINFQCQC